MNAHVMATYSCACRCECRVAQIIARESGEQAKVVGRRPWSATSLFPRRWLTDSDRDVLKKVSKAPDAAPAVTSEVVAFERKNTQTVTRK
jgi:hypothetical protein